jgi:hypothetical protein
VGVQGLRAAGFSVANLVVDGRVACKESRNNQFIS